MLSLVIWNHLLWLGITNFLGIDDHYVWLLQKNHIVMVAQVYSFDVVRLKIGYYVNISK